MTGIWRWFIICSKSRSQSCHMLGKEESRGTGSVSGRARAPEQASVCTPFQEYLFPFWTPILQAQRGRMGVPLWHHWCSASGYSRLPSRHTDIPGPCETMQLAHLSGSPVVFWDPCPHSPREDLFLTTLDVCLACVSWQVACQLAETSGSAVSAACILHAQVRVSVRLAREAWVSSLLPVLTRSGRDVLQSFARLSPVTDDIHSLLKCAAPTEMRAKLSLP